MFKMKAILEFNLPDDKSDFYIASRASEMHSALLEIQDYLRDKRKYTDEKTIDLEEFTDFFHNTVEGLIE